MNEKTRDNIEQALNDSLDRMWACEADSDDYFKLEDRAIKLAQVLNEDKKIETQKEVELKKIEKDQDWKNPMFLIPILVPIAFQTVDMVYRSWYLSRMWQDVCKFEQENVITSTPGKWVVRTAQDMFTFKKRG